MKRPPQLWVISIGLLCAWLLPNALGLRATSLIFGKTTTTTSTTSTTEAGAPGAEEAATVSTSESSADNQTATRPPLTGIPQIDYIWDPNLPFELNGYNLSDYPFYDRVPAEEIDFKCDGLHDGFYASVPHKCQVYHHCLYGTRYDFLCANFTAFDQKTFICHFASEVDCANSKNYWHRNDALYQAASTTTPSTTTIQAVVTPSPALNPDLRRVISPLGRPGRRKQRPFRRPVYDYYYDDEYDDRDRPRPRDRDREHGRDGDSDDFYDDPPRRPGGSRRRQRPRPNRRPIEYDEYEEYEDDRFDRRPSGRRDEDRRPYRDDDRRYDDRRPSNKNKDIPVEDDEDDKRTDDRRKAGDRRRPSDDRRTDDDYDRRSYDRPRKPSSSRDRYEDDKDEDRVPLERPRKTDDDKNDRRSYDRPRKPDDDDRRYRPKDQKTASDDKDDRRSYDRPRKPIDEERRYRPRDKSEERSRPTEEPKPLIKPSSGSSVYDRPRAPPIIRRPVPKTEREKFNYKPPAAASKPSPKPLPEDEEYYEDYEDEPKLPPPKPTRKSTIDSRNSEERRGSFLRPRRPQGVSTRRPVDDIDDVKIPAPKISQDRGKERFQNRGRFDSDRTSTKPSVEEEYSDEYEEDKSSLKGESSRERERSSERTKLTVKESREPPVVKTESTTEESVSRERERERRPEPIVKIVKRPFLPSRGGNPYSARGLQPVGAKALDLTTEIITKSVESITEKPQTSRQSQEDNSSSGKSKTQSEEEVYYDDEEEDLKPVTKRPQGDFRSFRNEQPRTTQKPKVADNYRNPLDIIENEYDVTLNDALNPTLPNLPIRSVPTGFSTGRDGYLSQTFQRPRLIAVETPVLTAANSEYVYVKQPTARYNPYIAVQLNRQPYTTYQ